MNQLRIGLALEAGICITLIAVLLDKMSLAWANKQINYFENPTFFQRNKYFMIFVGVVIAGYILSYIGTFYFKEGFNYLFIVPHNKGISTEAFWNSGVDWILDNFFDPLKDAITAIAKHCMITWLTPIKISLRAVGISTLNKSWKLLHPLIFPASITSGETFLSPSKIKKKL